MSLFVVSFIQHCRRDWMYFCAVNRRIFRKENFFKYFAFSYGLYFIGISGLLLANIRYMDDNRRAMTGIALYAGRDIAISRVLTQWGAYLFGLQDWNTGLIADGSPLFQLLAIAILACGSIILVKYVAGQLSYIGLVAALPLGLSPYFLENLAFKFDAPAMAFSVVVGILPFLYIRRLRLFGIVSFVAVLAMLTTYQASNGVYILLFFFTIVCRLAKTKWCETEERRTVGRGGFFLGKLLLYGALAYAGALIFFEVFVHNYNATYEYKKGALVHSGISELTYSFVRNMESYAKIVWSDFHGTMFTKLFGFIAALFVATFASKGKTGKAVSMMAALVFVTAGFFVSYGLYFVLKEGFFQPRALCGFGCFLAILTIVTSHAGITGKIAAGILAYSCILASHTYANSLAAQHEYSNFRRNMMISDLLKIIPGSTEEKIELRVRSAAIKSHPVLENSAKWLPLIKRMNFEYLHVWWNVGWQFQGVHFGYFSQEKIRQACDVGGTGKPLSVYENRLNLIRQFPENCYELYFKQE